MTAGRRNRKCTGRRVRDDVRRRVRSAPARRPSRVDVAMSRVDGAIVAATDRVDFFTVKLIAATTVATD